MPPSDALSAQANTEQVEAVDHRAEAGRLLTLASGAANDRAAETYAVLAAPHATLALVDEVAKLRELFEKSAIEVMYGGETV